MAVNSKEGGSRSGLLARRFGSKRARFQSALAIGFVVVTVGFAAGAPGAGVLFADEGFWQFPSLFERLSRPAEQTYNPSNAPTPSAARHHMAHRHLWRSTRLAIAPAPLPLARQSVCVRLCDGYAFPVGSYRGDSDRATHAATCQATCPDAKTALYVVPAGSDRLDDAVSVATGQTYSALPDAFHYTTVLDDACTCHQPGRGTRTLSLLRDITLRRGDAVMTPRGFRVFHGGRAFPHRRTDFVALSKSRDIRKADRATFSALERASLKVSPATAQARPPKPAASLDGPSAAKPGA